MDNQINIKYMFTVIGGGWERVSRAYFIADDRVYFLNKFSPDDLKMLENHFDDITATLASVNFDTTGLDFVNHGTNVGFDMPTITMYRYEDGKYKKLWSEGDYRNSEAVDTIQSIFQDSGYLAKGGNPVCKYRYFMSGMFYPTDGNVFEINIPSPVIHDSEEEAMADGNFGYRFIQIDRSVGPVIVIFKNENFKVTTDEKGQSCLEQWVEGKIVGTYTFEQFKKSGGYIRMLKPECKGRGFIDGNTDFVPTEKTFADIFPDIQPKKLYYIDNEAYWIGEVKRNKEETGGEIPSFVIGEVDSDAEAAEIIANLDARRPDYQMTLAKKGCGMSFAEKYRVMRDEIGKILEIGGESR